MYVLLSKSPYYLDELVTQANILIDESCHVRLADFGLLTIISDPANLIPLSSYTPRGTVRWMSPELIAPQRFGLEKSRPTKSSDCYALGMVVYETISGKLPFHNDSDYTVSLKVVEGERPPRGRRGKFAESLWQMLELCWSPRHTDRPSIEDVLRCLQMVSSVLVSPSPGENYEAGDDDDDDDDDDDGDDWDSPSDYSIIQHWRSGMVPEGSTPTFPYLNHTASVAVLRPPSLEVVSEADTNRSSREVALNCPGISIPGINPNSRDTCEIYVSVYRYPISPHLTRITGPKYAAPEAAAMGARTPVVPTHRLCGPNRPPNRGEEHS